MIETTSTIHDGIIYLVIIIIIVFQLVYFLSNFKAINKYKKSLQQADELELVSREGGVVSSYDVIEEENDLSSFIENKQLSIEEILYIDEEE